MQFGKGGLNLRDACYLPQSHAATRRQAKTPHTRTAGVVHTHEGLRAHTRSLCEAWGWRETDRILHTLPLHHIHGLGCGLLCALEAGATVEFMPRFSPTAVWNRLTVSG